jgi:flagellar export protein FliJ
VKRYTFRLASVARVRAIELDRAVGDLAHARLERNAARDRTVSTERAYETLAARRPAATPAELRAHHQRLELAVDAIWRARRVEADAEAVVEMCLAAVAEADQRVRLLDQLDARSRARHTAEVLHEEQQVLDDLVTARQERAS